MRQLIGKFADFCRFQSVCLGDIPTGKQSSWPTKYEAEFAKMKSGGGGNIRVEAKK